MSWGPPIVNTYGMISGLGTTFENAFDKARQKADERQAADMYGKYLDQSLQPTQTGAPNLASGLLSAAQTQTQQGLNQGTQGPGAGVTAAAKVPTFQSMEGDAPSAKLGGNKDAFVQSMFPFALQASQQTGVDPRIIVAQSALETGFGRSAPGNNYFGIKGAGQTLATHENINGQNVAINDSFRAFPSMADSAQGYADFINKNPRYAGLKGGGSLEEQAAALQRSGYATDPAYGAKVLSIAKSLPPLSGGTQTAQAPTPPPRPQGVQVASADPNFAPQMPAGNSPSAGQFLVQQAQGRNPVSFPSSANAQPGSRVAPGTASEDDEDPAVPSGPGGTAIPPTRTAQAMQPGQVVYQGMPQQAGPPPQVAGSNGLAALDDQQRNMLRQMLANPVTRPQAMQQIQQLQQPDKIELKESGGMLYRVNTRTGQAAPVQGVGDNMERFDNNGTTYIRNKGTQETRVLVPSSKDETKDPEAYRKVVYARQNWQGLGLPDPTDPQNNAYWKDFATKTLGGGGGVTVNNKLPGAETARDAKIGGAIGEAVAEDIKAGSVAPRKLQTLAILDDANRNGGDDISSGPLGKAILGGKQAMSELFGIDTKGLPESEVTQKVGFELATQAAKSITSRPSQMEFGKALENVPGLLMSKPGRQAMTSILTQQARQDSALSKLAQNKANWDNWQQVKDDFYEAHPIMSPFTGKPFGQQDIEMLAKAAPAGAQPPPDGQRPASTAPVKVARPEDAMRLPPGTRFLDPNGVERIRP